jgi:hypothetical protein
VIHVYAFVEPPGRELPDLRGLSDRPLSTIRAPHAPWFAAVVTHHEGRGDTTATLDDLQRHEAVAEALMADRTVVPARFGTRYREERDVVAVMEHAASRIAELMERVRGRVEIGIRVLGRAAQDRDDASRSRSGREYLASRAAAFRQADRDIEAARALEANIRAAVRPWAEHVAVRIRPDPITALAAAVLVPAADVPSLQKAVAGLDRICPWPLVSTGPWPPYSFTSEALVAPEEVPA